MEQGTMFRGSVFYEMGMACDSAEEKAELWQAIMEYGLFGTEPPSKFKRDFVNVKFILERSKEISKKRSISGSQGGAPVGNQNAKKDWEKQAKQPKQAKQTKTTKTSELEIEGELELEIESMCDTHTAAADEKETKIRQTTATIKAERIGKLVLNHWNEKLGRLELRNSELTQRSYALDGVDLEQIDALIDRFKRYKDRIEEKGLQDLFFFNLDERILSDFLKNINRFEGSFEQVTGKLAKKDCGKQAIKKLLEK